MGRGGVEAYEVEFEMIWLIAFVDRLTGIVLHISPCIGGHWIVVDRKKGWVQHGRAFWEVRWMDYEYPLIEERGLRMMCGTFSITGSINFYREHRVDTLFVTSARARGADAERLMVD